MWHWKCLKVLWFLNFFQSEGDLSENNTHCDLNLFTAEMGIYICTINSFVHVIMYSYYFLSSFNVLRKRLTFVKPFITIIQLVQLVLILGQSVTALLPSCQLTNLFYLQVGNGAILIGFFMKFYSDSYMKRSYNKVKWEEILINKFHVYIIKYQNINVINYQNTENKDHKVITCVDRFWKPFAKNHNIQIQNHLTDCS